MLDAHNYYRSLHGSQPLTRDAAAERSAQAYAEKLAREGMLQHGDFNGYGQNLGTTSNLNINGYEGTSKWYNEIRNYNFADPSKSGYTGHFEQVVWANTRLLGVGVAIGLPVVNNVGWQMLYWVAHYYPPGRKGNYATNIRPPNYQLDPR